MPFFFKSKKEQLVEAVQLFPAVFRQAQEDWAKFKLGLENGLFNESQKEKIIDWFSKFPEAWRIVRPTYEFTPQGLISPRKAAFADEVDRWVEKLTGSALIKSNLGFVFTTIAVGVFIAATIVGGGVVLVQWREQENITKIIDGELAGKFPKGTVKAFIDAEKSTGIFADIQNAFAGAGKLGILGAVLILSWPTLKKLSAKGLKA